MKLIIAEKPDQGEKLAAPFPSQKKRDHIQVKKCELFPEGAIVTWAIGHLCELLPPEEYNSSWKKWHIDGLPIIPEQFKYRVIKSKWKAFKVIKEFVHHPDIKEVIIAGDAEREGEAIVRLVLQQSKNNKPMKRLWISSLTANAVKKGFAQLVDEETTRTLFNEAISRAYADWLIGMNASRAYTLLLQKHGAQDVFSTGRVQTPTLALIVKREEEIERFKPEPFWEVKATFSVHEHLYEGTWHKEGDSRLTESSKAEKISAFCKGKKAEVQKVSKNQKDLLPPYLFNLSSLQSLANKRFKFPPKKTLDIAQKLYVKGYISYPRTDSNFITREETSMFPEILSKIKDLPSYQSLFPLPVPSLNGNKRYVNEKKVKDHYAIIPTEQVIDPNNFSDEEKKIYKMIIDQFIAAHYDPCKMNYTTIETLVDGRATFRSKGKQVEKEGWRKVIPFSQDRTKHSKEEATLPLLEEGNQGVVGKVYHKESKTQPPKRFTEGDLITLMKSAGKHMDDESLIKVMAETEGLGTEATRAGIIGILKDRSYIEVTKNQVYPTEKGRILIAAVGQSILASPEMTAKWEQRLAEIGDGKAAMEPFLEQAKQLCSSIINDALARSPEWSFSKEHLEKIQSSKPAWKGKKRTSSSKVGSCPVCKGHVIDKGKFYGCSEYRKGACKFTLSKTILHQTIPVKQVKLLLSKGETEMIEGFRKNDKIFTAALQWNNEQKKIIFSFSKNAKGNQ
ncbi:DNA topoisomerase III [Salipaludibacillus keqinensis]|uniref:DNA topoisomerase n=1 Tax=Salipaludibacillus keqinensis TaxID=2045207 RepID=A0A323TM99_9BACI|nr:DNA topoisomerase III [Salipaludibacillus keqinensis]PYZ95174.1 DNA topoisomerase III [Salipaludibacillus keqinensis]